MELEPLSTELGIVRWMLRDSVIAAFLAGLTVCLVGPVALAQGGSGDSAAAQVLFDEARNLAQAGDHEGACPKFAESHRLDPQLGTLLNVARCYKTISKNASAWARYVEAAEMAAKRDDPREAEARKQADELEPLLAKLIVNVTDPPDGIEVTRGGEPVREALWGSEVPVDAGEYQIRATAPGYEAFETSVTLEDEGRADVTVPPLKKAAESSGNGAGGDTATSGTGQLVAGIVVGAVGLAGVGVGAAFAAIASSKDDESLPLCDPDDPTICSPEGVTLRDEAREAQTVSIVSFIGGGALAITGVLLIATSQLSADDSDESASIDVIPNVGLGGAALELRVRF